MESFRKSIVLSLAVVMILSFSLLAKGNTNLENSEKSLLSAIESENIGLTISSIQILGELNSVSAVLPLMKILHESECEEARIAASLSLYKICDKRGIFALRFCSTRLAETLSGGPIPNERPVWILQEL